MIATDTPICRAILAAVAREPGELTPDLLAEDLDLPVDQVRRLCGRLREAGVLAPSCWRVYLHVPEIIEWRGLDAVVWGDAGHAELLRPLVEIGPLDGPAYAAALGVPELTGAHKRDLDLLHAGGLVATPSCLWIAP